MMRPELLPRAGSCAPRSVRFAAVASAGSAADRQAQRAYREGQRLGKGG